MSIESNNALKSYFDVCLPGIESNNAINSSFDVCFVGIESNNAIKSYFDVNQSNNSLGNTDFGSLNVFSVFRVLFLPDSKNTIENYIALVFEEINWD